MIHADVVRRAVRFEHPPYIPVACYMNPSCWERYPNEQLNELHLSHPKLFPDFEPVGDDYRPEFRPDCRAGEPFTDPWGCLWETHLSGTVGMVHNHPLADWSRFDSFQAPDPAVTDGRFDVDWSDISERLAEAKRTGQIAGVGLPHGYLFLMLVNLRGYENLMFDMADEEPKLDALCEMLAEFYLAVIQRYLDCGADWIGYPEDLGMQRGPMLSPQHFRRYIQPIYQRVMAPAKQAGAIVHMHCDGDVRDISEDLLACGMDVLNIQDLVNGVEWIAENLKGRVCIDLDIDRQNITVRGRPDEIRDLVRREIDTLASPAGGLTVKYGMYPGTPVENASAVMDAMESYLPE